jgi:PAS domain-containing protein
MTEQPRPSVRMGEEELWGFIRSSHTGIFTTLRSDGSPVALPVWFALLDRTIYIRTRGKKLLRVARNGVSSFLVEDGEHWATLRAAHMSGVAKIVEADEELRERYQREMDRKYESFRTKAEAMPESSQKAYATGMELVRFEPQGKILNWNNAHLMSS